MKRLIKQAKIKPTCIPKLVSKLGEIEALLNDKIFSKDNSEIKLTSIYFSENKDNTLVIEARYFINGIMYGTTEQPLSEDLSQEIIQKYNLSIDDDKTYIQRKKERDDMFKNLRERFPNHPMFKESSTNPYELYKSDLNYHDDGNDSPMTPGFHVEDPSMADFIQGYKLDPYKVRYFDCMAKAISPKQMERLAWKEVDVLEFNPKYLADKILKLWNQIDGPLQNVFEAFTLRYDTKLKQDIAAEINKQGYEVYPILLIQAPMYAGRNSKIKRCISIFKKLIPTFGMNHLIQDLEYASKMRRTADKKSDMLINYYVRLFPEDYSLKLVKNFIEPRKDNVYTDKTRVYEDFQISDDSLKKMEEFLSGEQESLVLKDNPYDAYDFKSNLRYDTTAPNTYEVSVGYPGVYKMGSKKKH